jgi:parallel beta-helix repeat protein
MSDRIARVRLASRKNLVAVAVVLTLATSLLLSVTVGHTPRPADQLLPHTSTTTGYWLVDTTGTVRGYGAATALGSVTGGSLVAPVVDLTATPDSNGYWLVAADGGVFAYGDAPYLGSMGGRRLEASIVGMAPTTDGKGYWLVAADGGVFAFGDAGFDGSMGGKPLEAPIVGMAATPDGNGYWLVAADGGIFAFGDAGFYGSMGGRRLAGHIAGMTATSDGKGYMLVAVDGGVFAYGDAAFEGSAGGMTLAAPIAGMATTFDGNGYWLVASDGGVFSYGDAGFRGSAAGSIPSGQRVTAIALYHGVSTSAGTGSSGSVTTTTLGPGTTSSTTTTTMSGGATTTTAPASGSGAPTTPPVTWCESGFADPYASAPAGAVVVPAGDNSSTFANPLPVNTTYYLAGGIHTLGTSQFAQIVPGNDDRFIGGPGAVLNGQSDNAYAFTQHATGVTIEYLTIENFTSPNNESVVNHDSGEGWTVEYNTIEGSTQGEAVNVGSNGTLEYNCITHNAQEGVTSYVDPSDPSASALTGGEQTVTVEWNEVSFNDGNATGGGTYDQHTSDQCGCAGGLKFWQTAGGMVANNYVHDNGDVGIWVDTDNTGFNIAGNYVSQNYAEGIMYEISYNATIDDNTLVKNGIASGESNSGFPTGAIYVSESGGDARVPGYSSGSLSIEGNQFTDNWGGVVLWENANRFCSDGSDGVCTLVAPSVYTISACTANLPSARAGTNTGSPSADYADGCRWKTQNVRVSGNTFDFTPGHIGSACTVANTCGFNSVFSDYGDSNPTAFAKFGVPNVIAFDQGNRFIDNTYSGPWSFWAWNQGNQVTWAQWTAPVTDKCLTSGEQTSGMCTSGFGQDAGSTAS